jgi:FKBP-type peptidyl-prolyl cis-trans isomerase FkpA
MKTTLFIGSLSILLFSCQSEYPGYIKAKNGIYYQLHEIGDDTISVKSGDFITAEISYCTINDSLFFHGNRKFQVGSPAFPGSIEECFTMLSKEDKASFIISADSFFLKTLQHKLPPFIPAGSDMKVEIKIIDIQQAEDYQHEKEAFLRWIEDFGAYEREILQQYLNKQKLTAKPSSSGLYFICLKHGNGKKVEPGKIVEIDYEGKFLNGKFFDSTKKRKEPQTFVYGTEMQVIPGLDEAVGMMEEGEKAMVILPSELAWGAEGSSTEIVPPYTTTIFEVEVKSVKNQ